MALGYWMDYMKIFIAHAQTIKCILSTIVENFVLLDYTARWMAHGLYENVFRLSNYV